MSLPLFCYPKSLSPILTSFLQTPVGKQALMFSLFFLISFFRSENRESPLGN